MKRELTILYVYIHTQRSKAEYERLQQFQTSGRIQEFALEGVDLLTDFAFVATLAVFSQDGVPSDSFLSVLASVVTDVSASANRNLDFFKALFAVALTVLLFNIVLRAVVAVKQFLIYRKHIVSGKDWLYFLLGAWVIQVSPHNGILYLAKTFPQVDEATPDDLEEVKYLWNEVKFDSMLLLAEDFPQFIVQLLFFTEVRSKSLTPSWYIATITTVLKLFTTGTVIAVNFVRYLAAKRKVGSSSAVTSSSA